MPETAVKPKLLDTPGPFGELDIFPDESYDPVAIVNDGTLHVVVHFPAGTNVCEIKLNVKFKQVSPEHKIFRESGGTVVIGG
jgi:hypothetical protein